MLNCVDGRARVFDFVLHWIWRDSDRRARKLLRFAETEADGGRDLVRAAEVTADPLLRKLYLRHASDEARHARLFADRGAALLRDGGSARTSGVTADWLAPGERGLDDVRPDSTSDAALLAFLHLSEKAAVRDLTRYRDVLAHDPATRRVFEVILRDEVFHMTYTFEQLGRKAPQTRGWLLWRARLGRLWKGYLRLAMALAGVLGTVLLTLQYFIVLPPFAWLAKRAAKRQPSGWVRVDPGREGRLSRQY